MKSRAYKLWTIVLGSIGIYWIFWNSSSWIAPLHLPSHSIIKFITKWGMALIPMIITLFILQKPKNIIRSMGLDKSFIKGTGIAFIFTLPLYIGFFITGDLNTEITTTQIIYKAVLAALFEELVFRGFMFGQLFRYGKTGFFWAALFPAILFGILHIYQGHDLLSSLAAFTVTSLGAFYFSWIYAEWNFNLWVPVGVHFFMNLSWLIFSVQGTEVAAGGLISNTLRIASIILAITLTVICKRKTNSKIFNYPVWKIS